MNGCIIITIGGLMSRVFFLIIMGGALLNAQTGAGFGEGMMGNTVNVPIGATVIDGETYFTMRLQPELTFGKVGVGLDVPIMFNSGGKFRTDEYKGGIGFLRVIRYVRYGVKHEDPVYFRVGELTGTSLGYGLIMYNYTNSVSFDKRKIGLNIDLNYNKQFGIEGVYSDFNRASVIAFRPYYRPLATTDIPILKTLEVGASYATDRDQDAEYDIAAAGADLGVTVLQTSFLKVVPYLEYVRIGKASALSKDLSDAVVHPAELDTSKYGVGQGFAMGVNLDMNLVADVLTMGVKVERRFYSDNFIPQYFNATYEVSKLNGTPAAYGLVNARAVQGTYGELMANLIGKIQVIGGMSIPDKLKKTDGAVVHLGLAAPDLIPKVQIIGTYDKAQLEHLGDAFKLDQRSVAHMIFAYEAYQTGPFVFNAGVDYKWTFIERKNSPGFKAVSYVMPFAAMQMKIPGMN